MSSGWNHTLALGEHLYSWGRNCYGQLGVGDKMDRDYPSIVQALKGKQLIALVCGSEHNVVLTVNKELFEWGWAEHGQLGLGDEKDRHYPTLVGTFAGQNITHIGCGNGTTMATTE